MVLRRLLITLAVAGTALPASGARAQIEQQLAAYTGRNAQGYLGPLVDAIGTDLNSGVFHDGWVPTHGFYASVEFPLTTVFFGRSSRTFVAYTEGDFRPESRATAPTVVGPTKSVSVPGVSGTTFRFPGGFDVDNFPFAVPQLRIGAWHGTEAILRYLVFDPGRSDLGNLSLYGVGMRHSVSQYLGPRFPLDLAVGFLWQSVSLGRNQQGDNLIASDALCVGFQMSHRFGALSPYAGLSFDWFSMDVTYETDAGSTPERIALAFRSSGAPHGTFGMSYRLAFLDAYGEYDVATQDALSVGLAIQYTSSSGE